MLDNFFKLNGHPVDVDIAKFQFLLDSKKPIENVIFKPNLLSKKKLLKISADYKISNKIFRNVSFSHTKIVGLNFTDCIFECCLFIGCTIKSCEFHNCQFVNSNPYKILIENSYLKPSSFKNCLNPKDHQNIGVHLYQILMKNGRSSDQLEFEADARFQFKRWQRHLLVYDFFKKKNKSTCLLFLEKFLLLWKIITSCVFEFFFGFGVRVRNFVRTAVLLVLLFWFLNFNFQKFFGLDFGAFTLDNVFKAFYYTVITLTTVGYGDIVPTEVAGYIWSSVQSIIGFTMFALLTSMFYRKIAS